MLGEKETYKYFGALKALEADNLKQVAMKEKIKKSISDEQGNFSKPLFFSAGGISSKG